MFDNARLSNKTDSSEELDAELRKKGSAKHQIEFMGVKPRVDTNRPLSLAQMKREREKKVKADKLSRRLNAEFTEKLNKARRKDDREIEQLGARLDQFNIIKQQERKANSIQPLKRSQIITGKTAETLETSVFTESDFDGEAGARLMFSEQDTTPKSKLFGRQAVLTEAKMKQNDFMARL